jgi:NDP-sugar pyrophosphorylase family protein
MPPVAILAGGLATRLYPLTRKMPKSLLKLAGKPFVSHQLALLRRQGISDVVLCVGTFGGMIRRCVKDGRAWGLRVRYSFEHAPLGTGGAIRHALPMLPDAFFVLYGDAYLDIDLRPVLERFESAGKPLLMTIYRNENKWDKSNIIYQNGQIIKYDKQNATSGMEHIDYGLMLIEKRVFDDWPDGAPFDLSELLAALVERGEAAACEVRKRFHEIGSADGMRETERYLLSSGDAGRKPKRQRGLSARQGR